MDSREYKLVVARQQARALAVIAFLLAVVCWIVFGIMFAESIGSSGSSNASTIGAVGGTSLALAVTLTVIAGAGLVVTWLSAALGGNERM
jgi:hypothetical protein